MALGIGLRVALLPAGVRGGGRSRDHEVSGVMLGEVRFGRCGGYAVVCDGGGGGGGGDVQRETTLLGGGDVGGED